VTALPGARLLAIASRWFDAATVSRVFEPLVADWQREWIDAAPARRARVRARGVICFLIAITTMAPRALVLTPTPPAILRRVVARLVIFLIVSSTILSLPFLFELRRVAPGRLAELLLWLLPAGLALVFPFAMGYIVDGVRRHARPAPVERIAVVRTAIAAVVFMLVFVGWVVPATNQQFRLTVKADPWHPPARGFRELTTYQLFTGAGPQAFADPNETRAVSRLREQHQRISFLVLPLVLIWLRWRALDYASPRWLLPPGLAATVMLATYFGMRWNDRNIESFLGAGPGFGAWAPILLFVIIGLARDRAARRMASWT
jgi:hypothetical protein